MIGAPPVTGAPLPSWRALLALIGPNPDPLDLARPWLMAPGDHAVWFSRSSWALHAIAQAWIVRHGRPPRLWVPDYFCNGTLDPVRRTGASLVFYPMTGDLAADWDRAGAMGGECDLVLLAHLFGRPADGEAARRFCRERGALLIEDCAHVLLPDQGMGGFGDLVLWSPHKLLPVPQGGLLIRRGAGLDLPLAPTGPVPAIGPWLIKRLVQKLAPGALLPPATRTGPQGFADDPDTGPMPATPALAPGAARMLAACRADAMAALRRRSGARSAEVLTRLPGWQVLFDPATTTPYRLVMRCDTVEIATARFDAFRRAGIPVESWPDMPPEIGLAPEFHGTAIKLRATLLCFPVHQMLDLEPATAACDEGGN